MSVLIKIRIQVLHNYALCNAMSIDRHILGIDCQLEDQSPMWIDHHLDRSPVVKIDCHRLEHLFLFLLHYIYNCNIILGSFLGRYTDKFIGRDEIE
jgi:hypothetical protein